MVNSARMATAEEIKAADSLIRWKRDPVLQCVEQFHFEPDRWQATALRAFPDPAKQRIALQACVGPGKTLVEAIMGWNFLTCYVRGQDYPQAAAMSIDGANLKANLWKELAKWRDRSPLLVNAFEMNSDVIYERNNPLTWRMEARTWPKKADAEAQGRTLSGLHAKFILYLIDECGDIPPAVLLHAEQGLSNCEFGKIVVAGNPSSHAGILYFVVKEQPDLWFTVRVTGDPDDPERSPRIALEWARTMIAKHGRENPWVMYAILGLFPPVGVNALFGPDEVAAAMARHIPPTDYEAVQSRIGIDVARFGDDKTVLFARQGLNASKRPVELRAARTEDIAARLILAKQRIGSELELIDDSGGWSAGVQDLLRLGGVNVYPVNFGGKADDARYFNKRTEMYWRLSEWIKAGVLPNLPELSRELCAHTYWYEDSKIRLTEKDQVKAELQGHSPDLADALALTFALVDMPSNVAPEGLLVGGASDRQHKRDWDPRHDA